MGTAETPAAPITGFTFPFEIQYMSFPRRTPPAVAKMKATQPSTKIIMVSHSKKAAAVRVEPTVMPSMMTTVFIRAFCAVSDSLSTTRHSRRRLPKANMPINGAARGTRIPPTTATMMGNSILAVLEARRGA